MIEPTRLTCSFLILLVACHGADVTGVDAGDAGQSSDASGFDCAVNGCLNGGTCVADAGANVCACPPGYAGPRCGTDINECGPSPCLNGGTCTDMVNGYSCTCLTGFTGTQCETNIDDCASRPCHRGGVCIDGTNSYTCQCAVGFTGPTCELNVDDCTSNPCSGGATCVDGFNDYDCHLVNPGGTVADTRTGLVWQQAVDAGTYTSAGAATYCSNLTLDGASDWRLPSVLELLTIIDFTRYMPAIDPVAFPNAPALSFATTTANALLPGESTDIVNFYTGSTSGVLNTDAYLRVRCVRNTAALAQMLTINAGGTVTDTRSGLTWQQDTDSQTYSHVAAVDYCANLTLDGASDWRLPTVVELLGIVDYAYANPSIDPVSFPGTPIAYFWTSSVYAASPDSEYLSVFFYAGTVDNFDATATTLRVRCVR